MKNFKITCRIETEEKGIHEVTIYIKDVKNESEAERSAKYHFLEKPNTGFYGVIKCEPI